MLPVDAVAVTVGPGLVGSLLVGKIVGEMLGWIYRKPLVGVNHLEAHLLSVLPSHPELQPPYLALLASGGHTELVHVKQYGKFQVLGRTRDDAAGEAFDKVAKLLQLGYPGGPAIDRLSVKGDAEAVNFPRPFLNDGWDFSFSGLKTSVVYHLRDNPGIMSSRKKVANVCASFQAAVVEVLVKKTLAAAEHRRRTHRSLRRRGRELRPAQPIRLSREKIQDRYRPRCLVHGQRGHGGGGRVL